MRSVAAAALFAVLAAAAVLLWWRDRVEAPIVGASVGFQTFDDYVYYYPTFRYAFDEARAGRFPFWNPYQHCGTPFFANGQHLLLYPLNALYWWLPTDEAMKWTNQLHIALALAFTFFLGRVVGMSRVGAASAGIVYGFCPGLALLIYLPHHLYGATWIPLHLALTHLAMTGRRPWRWGFLLSLALAAQYLGSYPMFSLFSLYMVAGYALWSAGAEWRIGTPVRRIGGRLAGVGFAVFLAAAWIAPQLLPAMELARESPRHGGALTIAMADTRPARLDLNALLSSTLAPLSDVAFFRPHPHVGVLALVLAMVASLHRGRRRTAGFFFAAALFFFLLALGRRTPLYSLYFAMPTGNLFRRPDRFFILVSLGLAVLAGEGTDYLWQRARQARRAPWWGVAMALVLAVAAWSTLWIWESGSDVLREEGVRLLMLYAAGVSTWLCLLLTFVGTPRRLLVAAVPVALYATLFHTFINHSPLPDTHPYLHRVPPTIAAILRQRQGLARTYIPPPGPFGTAGHMPSKAGMLEHLYAIGDRENVFVQRIWHYTAPMDDRRLAGIGQGEFRVSSSSRNLRLLDLMGVRYIAEKPAGQFLKPSPARVFPVIHRDASGVIYENPTAKPRAYLVHDAEHATSTAAALARVVDPSFDVDSRIVIEAPAEPPPRDTPAAGSEESARIAGYEPHRVTVDVEAAAPAYLVLTDQYYPGWEADVDGQAAPIERANYLFRAVAVPAGKHRVVFRYVPRSFYAGVVIALVAGAGVLAASWYLRRRSSAGVLCISRPDLR